MSRPILNAGEPVAHGLQATLYAVTPTGRRHSIASYWSDACDEVLRQVRMPDCHVQYFEVAVCRKDRPEGPASPAFLEFTPRPRSDEGADVVLHDDWQQWAGELVRGVARCQVPATFRPQAWVDDYAVDIDGKTSFNCLGALLSMDADEVRAMFGRGRDFDRLADGLPAREGHEGPFEVDVDAKALLRLINQFAAESREIGSITALSDHGWRRFVQMTSSVQLQRGAGEGTRPVVIANELQQARRLVQRLYEALSDASGAVSASEGEQYAYQAELEEAKAFLGPVDDRLSPAPLIQPYPRERGG